MTESLGTRRGSRQAQSGDGVIIRGPVGLGGSIGTVNGISTVTGGRGIFGTVNGISTVTGGGFDPVSLITGNGGFWRADKGVTSGAGAITAWTDQSSFGHNLSNNGTVTFSNTGFNTSFPGLDFSNGGSSYMTFTFTGSSFYSTTVTAFMLVFLQGSVSNSNNRLMTLEDLNGGQDFNSQSFILAYGGGATTGFYGYAANTNTPGTSGAVQGNGGSGDALTTGNPYLVGLVFDGANCNSWVNGSVVGSGTTFTANLGSNGGASSGQASLQIGATVSGMSNQYQLAAVGLTQRVMNSTDWTNLKNWCNANWGTSF